MRNVLIPGCISSGMVKRRGRSLPAMPTMNRVLPGAYSLTRRAKTALRTHFETKGLDWMQVTPEEILTALPRIALLTGVGVVTIGH